MTEEHYKKIRTSNLANPLQVLYIYYQDETNEQVEPAFFVQSFQQWLGTQMGMPMQEGVSTLIKYYDAKFNVTRLQDVKTGKILKII